MSGGGSGSSTPNAGSHIVAGAGGRAAIVGKLWGVQCGMLLSLYGNRLRLHPPSLSSPNPCDGCNLPVAAGAPTISAYGLIALLRYTMTLDHFQSSHFLLGHFAKRFYVCTFLFNGLIFAVMILPFFFPACVTFGAVTIFGILTLYFTPLEKWLRRKHVLQALHSADEE
ncbi:hypothetical protein BDP27DRAFT_1433658 [Rhodocollybia butyracea]|uniref:Uncharacterized protein n=1 Tax=Rhodocollybia butyracea TaxID=206335 RepID=A0A9P5TXC8_9AGAR|nr:hypothetical protein BDP27DRAFT_1433658 [Rhodocollybia butyracea]